jgi:hypothetical protein
MSGMKTIKKYYSDDLQQAYRAMSAMFFAIFGGAWITYWGVRTFQGSIFVLEVIAACTVAIFVFALNRYLLYNGTLTARGNSPQRRRMGRLFNIVNVGQWVVVLIGACALTNIGFDQWLIPFVIFVFGLHFLPLAKIFSNVSHSVTGIAMIVIALAYPFLFHDGPNNPIGCLGAGLVLWVSAFLALREKSDVQASIDTAVDL